MRTARLVFAFLLTVGTAAAQDPTGHQPQVMLWQEGAPGAVGSEPADQPRLSVYQAPAEKANGCAIVVCPGGGYGGLAKSHEGHEIGTWLNELGVSAFVLTYRHAPRYKHPTPMLDVQRAIRTVRARAAEWKVDPQRVGVLGFSAGGHLASTAATHFDGGDGKSADAIDRVGCRPDFAILCYAVITMEPGTTHGGSRRNLLGETPPAELVDLMSNEKQVTKETPPTFLWHTNEDAAVLPENSVLFYSALRKAGVPAELHIYEKGRHGIGLGKSIPGSNQWPVQCREWLSARGYLTPR